MAALCNRTGHIYFHPVVSSIFLLSSFFISSPNLSRRRLDVHIWCGLGANLECRYEMYCARLAGNAGRKKSPKNRHLGIIAQLCWAISLQLRHIDNGKKTC